MRATYSARLNDGLVGRIEIAMNGHDFDLHALYDALDARRLERELSWAGVVREMSGSDAKKGSASTLTGLRERRVAEGDGVLTMLRWLDRTPESFVPGTPDSTADRFRLPAVPSRKILRWNARALFQAADQQRQEKQLTWTQVAREIGGFTPAMLTGLAKGGRVAIPPVMRLVRWLNRPAASFTHLCDW